MGLHIIREGHVSTVPIAGNLGCGNRGPVADLTRDALNRSRTIRDSQKGRRL